MKTRGTPENPANRFHATHREAEAEWLPVVSPDTRILRVKARSLITRNESPDVPFDRSINPYQGCEHGCVYCYARPSHANLDLSPGLDFETRIFAKTNAVEVLEAELRRPGYRCQPICIGANTDAYQPAERRLRLTRGILDTCLAFGQPVTLITKSALIERDIDLLAELAARRLVSVAISVTTLDHALKRRLEPRTAGPAARLRTMENLALAGVPVSVLMAPVIPKLNDHEIEAVLEAAHDHGARAAAYIFLRLPREVADLFAAWLERHYPDRARAVLSLVRQSRDGRTYDARFGTRMSGTGPFAGLIRHRFETARRRLGLEERSIDLDSRQFAPPPQAGDQLALFG